MVLHTDEPHPHVHMVVKAMSEQGVRLNIRKATLREWRREFSHHLREQGIEANATERAVRGQYRSSKKDAIYRADLRGASTYMRNYAQRLRDERPRQVPGFQLGLRKLATTRREVQYGWAAVADRLQAAGQTTLATVVHKFAAQLPSVRTDWRAPWPIKRLHEHSLEQPQRSR
jgi:hypothetical protein